MAEMNLLNVSGENVGTIELNDSIFGIEPNKVVLHEIVKNYLANQRQGTQSAQTRSEVTGCNQKPFRQKGTGRARQGSIKSPLNYGGGVVFAPKPRDYSYKLSKKKKRLGLKSILSAKVAEEKLNIVEDLTLDAPKTKDMVNILVNVSETNTKNDIAKTLIVLEEKDQNVLLSARNIPKVKTTFVGMLNVYDLLNHDEVLVTKAAIEKLEEVYA